jgi:hypothetical protein
MFQIALFYVALTVMRTVDVTQNEPDESSYESD